MQNLLVNRLDQLTKCLNPLLPLANSHMVDFFTNNIYQNYLSPEIRNEIDNNSYDSTITSIFNNDLSEIAYPELQKFLSDTKQYSLSNFNEICTNLNDLEFKFTDMGCENLSGLHMEIFMSSKKSHEVEIMSAVANAVCEISKSDIVVDIGDGKGYLSSALSLHNSLNVLGIDSSNLNTLGAARRINKLKKVWKHGNNGKEIVKENELYKQATKFITEDTNLCNIVSDYFPELEINKLNLVGLHTCGNLSASCLKIFVNNPNVKTICNVGCCYHLLDEGFTENSCINSGFPLSTFLKNKRYRLGRNARMLAAQSLDRILKNKDPPSKILFYRALLQILLLKYHPNLVTKHVGKFPKKDPTFLEYVKKAFSKFGSDIGISNNEILTLYENYLSEEKSLQVFYLIRAHLAPVIETVILVDRLLFLKEHNYKEAFLVKMFDAVISPRCYGIVAFKNDCF